MKSQKAAEIAGALPGVTVKDHFGKDAFGAHKRLFFTVSHDQNTASLRLSPKDQRRFLAQDGDAFSAIDNAWGRQGWTSVNLEFISPTELREAMECAWEFSKLKSAPAKTTKPSKKKVSKKKK